MKVKPSGWHGMTPRAAGAMLTLALAFAAAIPGSVHAQPPMDNPRPAPFSNAYLSAGTLLVDVSKLNPHFERIDLPAAGRPGFFTLSNDSYAVGLGAYGTVMRRFVLGGEWNVADLGEESSPQGKTNHLSTNYWMGTLGFAAFTTWRLNVIPQLGAGSGKATLTLKSRDGGPTVSDTQDPTIDEIIASPGRKSTVTGSYIIVQPGIAVDLLVLRESESTVGLTLGVRLATAISPNRTTWRYQGRPVFGAPDLGPSGGVLRIVAGVGGFRMSGGSPR
jgi:hypothetical protein